MPDLETARRHALGDLLRRSALRDPDKTAIVHGELRQTFSQLDETVNRTANALAQRGVEQGDRIALFGHNSHGFVVASIALARLGAILVPINFMLGAGEVRYILEHSGAGGIIAEDALVATAEQAGAPALRIVIGEHEGWESLHTLDTGDATEPSVLVGDDDPIAITYTSGTESRPKGAVLTSRSLISQFVSCIVDGEYSHADVEVHPMPLYHCAQSYCFLFPDLYLGATSIILPGADPGTILNAIDDEQATKLFCPPTVWIGLLRHPEFDKLRSLRKGYYGASAMPVEILKELLERLPQVRLYNFYGQTEMSPMATLLRPEDQLRKAGSAGKPAINVETRVVDDHDQPVAAGEVGEIVHRSPHAMLGYWNEPEKTADAFRDGWFHSGDLGILDDEGYLSVVDRKKDMIKTGGENVASREVEEAIYAHPAVMEVAIFGLPDPKWIEAVTAAVVRKPGSDVSEEDLKAFCREHLAGFKVPKRIVFVDELPKNASGKILKRELRAAF